MENKEKLVRNLDCAVINIIHSNKVMEFDTVRSAFWEGDTAYPTAFFLKDSHIQICVRNPDCIKEYFLPIGYDR